MNKISYIYLALIALAFGCKKTDRTSLMLNGTVVNYNQKLELLKRNDSIPRNPFTILSLKYDAANQGENGYNCMSANGMLYILPQYNIVKAQ